jgi:hypothetical protein
MPLSNYAEKHLNEARAALTALPKPASLYLALLTAEADKTKTGATIAEATYTGYARVRIDNIEWEYTEGGAATVSKVVNKNAITLQLDSGANQTLVGFATVDSVTIGAGNVWDFGKLKEEIILQKSITEFTLAAKALELNAE